MDYIYLLGLVPVVMFAYSIPSTIVSMVVALTERMFKTPGRLFLVGRVIRGYLYTSVLLTFYNFYVDLGLLAIPVILICYFGLMFWWMVETQGASKNYYGNIEFKLAVDSYKMVFVIYNVVFWLFFFTNFPLEPWMTSLFLSIAKIISGYKIITVVILLFGLGILISYGSKCFALLFSKKQPNNSYLKHYE